jgi:hypothetical protein
MELKDQRKRKHSFHNVFIRTYAETDGVLLPHVLVTFTDFGYPV